MRQQLNHLKAAGAPRAAIEAIYQTMAAGERARREARVRAREMVAALLDRYSPLAPAEQATCPQCGGAGAHLGTLGSTDHFRCVNCGWDFSL